MARQLGFNIKLYFGGREISADASDFTCDAMADTVEVTNFGSAGYKENQGTLLSVTASFTVFYQSGVGTIGNQLTALYGSTEIASMSINEAGAIGDSMLLLPSSILDKVSEAVKVNDVIKMTVALKGNGKLGWAGALLHVLGAESSTGNSTAVDNSASSANGGRGTIHVTAVTGASNSVVIQHSTDNSTFADLITFSSLAVGATTTEVTGTVNRYVRDRHVPNTAVTYVAGFARY